MSLPRQPTSRQERSRALSGLGALWSNAWWVAMLVGGSLHQGCGREARMHGISARVEEGSQSASYEAARPERSPTQAPPMVTPALEPMTIADEGPYDDAAALPTPSSPEPEDEGSPAAEPSSPPAGVPERAPMPPLSSPAPPEAAPPMPVPPPQPSPGPSPPSSPAPAPAPTPSPMPAPQCGGVMVGSYCWYRGGQGQSCVSVCQSRGGVTRGTISYAGSSGSLRNCQAVLDALRLGSGTAVDYDSSAGPYAQGCALGLGVRRRYLYGATNQTDVGPYSQRACSCAQ